MARRKLDSLGEFKKLSDLPNSEGRANVHGVVSSLSPLKKSKSSRMYFDGELSDGEKRIRLYGFDRATHERLAKYVEDGKSVSVVDAELLRSKSGDIELRIGAAAKMKESGESFAVERQRSYSLSEVKNEDANRIVDVRVKCIRIEESEFVGSDNSKRIQRVLIADSSSLLWLALWEDNIGQLAEGKSYNLNGMRVKEYMNEKSLSATYGSSIDEIDDIGDVKEDAAEVDKSDSMSELVINGAEVIGVGRFEKFVRCVTLTCRGKIPFAEGAKYGECSLCGSFQKVKIGAVQILADLIIEGNDEEKVTALAKREVVEQLTGVGAAEILKITLMESCKFTAKIVNGSMKSATPESVRSPEKEPPKKRRKSETDTD